MITIDYRFSTGLYLVVQSLRGVRDPRLLQLLRRVHNPQLELALQMVDTAGQDLLQSLQGTYC